MSHEADNTPVNYDNIYTERSDMRSDIRSDIKSDTASIGISNFSN